MVNPGMKARGRFNKLIESVNRSMSKKKSKLPLLLICILLVGVIVVAFIPVGNNHAATSGEFPAADTAANAESLSFSALEAVVIPDSIPAKMLNYTGFNVSFNPRAHQPNYVAWTLEPHETDGANKRDGVGFLTDDTVPGCATIADYKRSGFDRGHMAPAADMKWSAEAMQQCHYLTNICPQDKSLNTGAWSTVEKNSRKWALRHGPIIIIAGPVLSDYMPRSIGPTGIPVPERFFKVVLAPEADPPMGIGFIMPNSYVDGGAQTTAVSIDEVERVTGFDFFSALPDDVESEVEQQCALHKWNR